MKRLSAVLALVIALLLPAISSGDTVYFSDNFESGLGKWEVSGYDWALIDTDSRSQTHSVTDSPGGNYPTYSNTSLTLAHPIDLTGSTSPVLSFWYKISMACYTNCNYWDYSYLEVSTDGGFNWTVLKAYNGTISTWQHELIDLSSYKTSSILIRFRVQDIYGYGAGDGWYIDDVEIKELSSSTVYFSDNFESGNSLPDFSDRVLTANPNPGWQFIEWEGCNSVNGNQCTVNTYVSKMVIAKFSGTSLLGDNNYDAKVDISDVILELRMALGLDPKKPCSDINGDGKVDISDVIMTLRMALGLDPLKQCTG